MRSRIAAALICTAAALAVTGFAVDSRNQAIRPVVRDRVVLPPGSPGDRIVPSPAELSAASAAGLVPADARSILRVDHALRYGEFVWRDRAVPAGPVEVVVDLRTQMISVFRSGHEIGSAVILYGSDDYDTPLGEHSIVAKARDHQSAAYDAPMPFTLWLTDDGVAIHASDVRRGRATHGCIGVPEKFAEHLFVVAQVGDPVRIVRSVAPRAATTAN